MRPTGVGVRSAFVVYWHMSMHGRHGHVIISSLVLVNAQAWTSIECIGRGRWKVVGDAVLSSSGGEGLRSLRLPSTLDSSSSDITQTLLVPALRLSVRYDRGVGYFSSSWLRAAAIGMVAFAANNARARWITSPILSADDWQALQAGEAAREDEILKRAIESSIDDLERSLKEETLSALAWLVADGILEFKLALPRNRLECGEFHDKFGVFADAHGNQVSFNGSPNDSIQAIRNYESVKIFCSWQPGVAEMVRHDARRFERLWNNFDPNVVVYDIPAASAARIVRLRTQNRPYSEPRRPDWLRIADRLEGTSHGSERQRRPCVPSHITLRGYQLQAVEAWFSHQCRGFLEMATGSGKTITALAASCRLCDQEGHLAVIVVAPYQHLVDQWSNQAQPFGYRPILAYRAKSRWLNDLNAQIVELNAGYRRFMCVITTLDTFITREFQGSIARLAKTSLLIADEAHHLGAQRGREAYPHRVEYRMALSATPNRWFDEDGTAALRAYFGETVFSFSLQQAIGACLTPYYYHPHLVVLTDDELAAYEALSLKIARAFSRKDERARRALTMLLIRRARLLNRAENKLPALSQLVRQGDSMRHALFYCAPKQIDDVLRMLGLEKGLLVHRFTAHEDPEERQSLLSDFAEGKLHALVAMRCLDEGVDVPETRTAFILASSSNPREFIQRRGRMLRQAPGKEHAVIHDLITVPPRATSANRESAAFNAERSIVRKELQRLKEFSDAALNKHQALDVVWDIASRYGLLDF